MVWGSNSLWVHLPCWSIYLCCQAAPWQNLDCTQRHRNTGTSRQPWTKWWSRPKKLVFNASLQLCAPLTCTPDLCGPSLTSVCSPAGLSEQPTEFHILFTSKGPFHRPSYQQCNSQDAARQLNHGRWWPALPLYLPKTDGHQESTPSV